MCGAAMGLNESSDGSERRRKDVRLPSILNSPERIFDTDFLPKLTRRKRRNLPISDDGSSPGLAQRPDGARQAKQMQADAD